MRRVFVYYYLNNLSISYHPLIFVLFFISFLFFLWLLLVFCFVVVLVVVLSSTRIAKDKIEIIIIILSATTTKNYTQSYFEFRFCFFIFFVLFKLLYLDFNEIFIIIFFSHSAILIALRIYRKISFEPLKMKGTKKTEI